MALETNSQFDFFKQIQIDDDGNLLVSITNFSGGSSFDSGGTMNGNLIVNGDLTVTGTTYLQGLSATSITATTITSPSILWDKVDSVIYPKDSDVTGIGNTNGLAHGTNITMSNNTSSAVIASNLGDVRKSTNSLIGSSNSSSIYNTERSSIFSSDASFIGVNTGTSSGERNAIIASESSTILNAGSSAYYGIYNSLILGSENSDIIATNESGETTERVILLGMKDYTVDNAPGVHVENLYITSGATADYVWTSTDSSGQGYWAASNTSFTAVTYLDCEDATPATIEIALDGGGASTVGFEYNANGGYVGGVQTPAKTHPYKVDSLDVGSAYTFSGEINVLSISQLTQDASVVLPSYPIRDFYVVKDKTGNAGTYPISISAGSTLINGESSYTINLGTKPSITFLWDGVEYITI